MISDLRRGFHFTREHGVPTALRAFSSPANIHPGVQFIKYVVCGVLATVFYQAVFAALGYTVLPHFESVSQGLTLSQRTWNFGFSSVLGFFASNTFCYLLNIRFVFQRGLRSSLAAFLMFTGFSSIGFSIGLAMAIASFVSGTTGSWASSFILLIASLVVNFVCRKFVVFKKS